MNVPDLGFEVLLQPALLVAAFVWGLMAFIKGVRVTTEEVDGTTLTHRRLAPGSISSAFRRWLIGGLLAASVVIVPLGHRAVVWSAWEEGPSVNERARGVSLVVPLLQQAHIVDVRTQKLSTVHEDGAASSFVQNKELLQYNLKCTVTWHVEPTLADELIQEVGPDYVTRLITQNLFDACREGVGNHTAVQLAGEIEKAQASIENIITPELEAHAIVVEGIQLEDVVPPTEFLDAVKAEEIADRNADEAENRVREERAKADQRKAAADGDAYVISTIAQAEADRRARLGMTPTEYIWYTRDNLVLPQIVAGDGIDFILPAPSIPEAPEPEPKTQEEIDGQG